VGSACRGAKTPKRTLTSEYVIRQSLPDYPPVTSADHKRKAKKSGLRKSSGGRVHIAVSAAMSRTSHNPPAPSKTTRLQGPSSALQSGPPNAVG